MKNRTGSAAAVPVYPYREPIVALFTSIPVMPLSSLAECGCVGKGQTEVLLSPALVLTPELALNMALMTLFVLTLELALSMTSVTLFVLTLEFAVSVTSVS